MFTKIPYTPSCNLSSLNRILCSLIISFKIFFIDYCLAV